MAVTEEEIAKWLEEDGLQYKFYSYCEQSIFHHKVEGIKEDMSIYIVISDEGRTFELFMYYHLDKESGIFDISSHKRKNEILTHIACQNFFNLYGTWEYSPHDGVRCNVVIPLEDVNMTHNQFKRIWRHFTVNIYREYKEILEVMQGKRRWALESEVQFGARTPLSIVQAIENIRKEHKMTNFQRDLGNPIKIQATLNEDDKKVQNKKRKSKTKNDEDDGI